MTLTAQNKDKNVFAKCSILLLWTVLLQAVTVALVWLKVVWLELDHPKIACEWRISLAERSIFVCLASWSSFVLDKVLYVKHLNFISDKELKKVMCPGKYLWKSRRRKRNYDWPNDFGLVIRPLSSYALRKLAALSPLSWKSDSC